MKFPLSKNKYLPRSFYEVCSILEQIFNSPRHHNKHDPFNELIFIICSLRTTEKQYLSAYTRIKSAFPKNMDLLIVDPKRLAQVIGGAGLGLQKAICLNECAQILYNEFGRVTLSPLRQMTNVDCETFLTSLPRVGIKTARCIMMYSLNRQVFPVDTHCWRIGKRLGWVRDTNTDGQPRKKEMDRYQKKIPPEFRYSMHVNMVAFGRRICGGRNPRCYLCPIYDFCRRIGIRG